MVLYRVNAEDPFKRSTPRKWRKLIGGSTTVVFLLVGVVFLALHEGPKTFEPAGIVDALINTSWALPREPSGLRRYGTQLGAETSVSLVAMGNDGRLALALHGDAARIVVWHAGQWRLHAIPETRTVTALGRPAIENRCIVRDFADSNPIAARRGRSEHC